MEQITKDYLKGRLDVIFNQNPSWTDLETLGGGNTGSFLYFLKRNDTLSTCQIRQAQTDFKELCEEEFDDFEFCIGYDDYLYIQFILPSKIFKENTIK